MERFQHSEVEGLRTGRFASRINTTCIVYRLGNTIIDTGPPNQWPKIRRFLSEREIEKVLVTHHHEDHSGNLAEIANSEQFEQPHLLAPAAGLRVLEQGFFVPWYQRIIWGKPRTAQAAALPATIRLRDGRRLHSIPAPGHSADMTCFLEPNCGWLFSGDLYIAAKIRMLRCDEDVRQQIDSLRKMLEIDFEILFCAHRGVIRDGKAALRRKLAFLEEVRGRAQQLAEAGQSVSTIRRQLLGREDLMAWTTAFRFSKRNLIESCLRSNPLSSPDLMDKNQKPRCPSPVENADQED